MSDKNLEDFIKGWEEVRKSPVIHTPKFDSREEFLGWLNGSFTKECEQRNKTFHLEPDLHTECQHSKCPDCGGTGRKKNGEPCVHMISCRCPKCSPRY